LLWRHVDGVWSQVLPVEPAQQFAVPLERDPVEVTRNIMDKCVGYRSSGGEHAAAEVYDAAKVQKSQGPRHGDVTRA
jgi:hypothetical protein